MFFITPLFFHFLKKDRLFMIVSFFSIILFQSHLAFAGQSDNIYQLIHDELSQLHSVDNYQNAINSRHQKQELPDILLAPGEKRSILLQAFAKFSDSATPVLSAQTVKDLHILSGTRQHPAESLLSKIGTTLTISGEIMLAKLLISPIADIRVLDQRQQAIKYLINHPNVFRRFEELLIRYAIDEDGLIALFDPYDAVNSPTFGEIDRRTHLPGLSGSGTQEEIARRLNDAFHIGTALNAPLGLLGSTLVGTFTIKNGIINGLLNSTVHLPSHMMKVLSDIQLKFSDLSSPIKIFSAGSFVVLQAVALYKSYYRFREHMRAYRFIVERSRRAGRALESAVEMEQLLEKHPPVQMALGSGKGFLKLHNSTSMVEIMSLLKDAPESIPTFLDYVSSNMGRYKRGLTLLKRNHLSLSRVMESVGELGAWITAANHLRLSLDWRPNRLIFPHYLSPPSQPQVSMEKLWNPLLPSFSAVANHFASGNNNPISTVITGPNAAGKSTMVKGIGLNIVLAQTLAVAAAEHMDFTPFSLIHTHLVNEPEVITGVSSFSAESKKIIELLNTLKSLPANQYSVVFFDELFSNTNPEEGETAALGLIEAMAMNPSNLSITSTHYPRIATLESQSPGKHQNFHFNAVVNPDGSLSYDYRLWPGASTQNVALDILREEGIDSDFLNIIQGMIQGMNRHPE